MYPNASERLEANASDKTSSDDSCSVSRGGRVAVMKRWTSWSDSGDGTWVDSTVRIWGMKLSDEMDGEDRASMAVCRLSKCGHVR